VVSCLSQKPLRRLPLATLYFSERCNSRCVSCDYWRHGRADLDLETVTRLLSSFEQLGTEVVLISGGEPLLHPQWAEIAEILRLHRLKLWLLTSGLSLAKHAQRVARLFDAVTVSMDGTDRESYAAIRGVDAFEVVCRGVRAAIAERCTVTLRVTLQRRNFRQLPAFVDLGRQLGVAQVSFLAIDVANSQAFGRQNGFTADLALRDQDLPELESVLGVLEREHADAFATGFVAESPEKLRRRILRYFSAVCGLEPHPPVRCNAPEFSAVIDAHGQVSPCFFIQGPREAVAGGDLEAALNGERMVALRDAIRAGARPECARCVCSMWRDLREPATERLPLARSA
jgi:MoaA/NifB/PqqE/SkfB family radical SAM enzyme